MATKKSQIKKQDFINKIKKDVVKANRRIVTISKLMDRTWAIKNIDNRLNNNRINVINKKTRNYKIKPKNVNG